jgi:hypothetical protein
MRIRSAGAAIAAVTLLCGVAPATVLAATPAQNKAFAKQLTTKIRPVFKKQVPQLVLGAVTCVLPLDGTVVACKAHFSDAPAHANVVYAIRATLKESGTISWTTTSHSCTDSKTGKKLPC